ncbi:hypothetical protein BDR26DRAFT_53055 [Obelidium mucronatum]|nr:hypothetical protein BDR26DRAFT_53055 [Obelidium mucronatum]
MIPKYNIHNHTVADQKDIEKSMQSDQNLLLTLLYERLAAVEARLALLEAAQQKESQSNTRLEHLPPEIVALILAWIEPRKVFSLRRVSKLFCGCLAGSHFAAMSVKRFYPPSGTTDLILPKWTRECGIFKFPLDYQRVYFTRVYPCLQTFALNTNPLDNKQQTTSFPTVFSLLPTLRNLHFDSARIGGPIPETIFAANTLEALTLDQVRLNHELPKEIGLATSLKYLSISRCGLRGNIPSEIGQLTNLTTLWLGYNHLSGSIPPEIGNLSKLNSLSLFGNQLEGKLPPELGNLVNLNHMYLMDNHLEGNIPETLGNILLLRRIALYNNKLVGTVPFGFETLKFLTQCDLRWNKGLTCPFPSMIIEV